MILKESNKNNYTRTLEILALLTAIFTPLLFLLGHLSAYFYFSSFDIPYFKYTDTYTAFSFALESIDVVLSVVAIAIVAVISFGILHAFSNNREYATTKIAAFKHLIKLMPKFLILAVLIGFVVNFFSGIIGSTELKQEIKEKRFTPYEIAYNQDKNKVKCVTSIGSLGQFQVFVTMELQPFLIQESSLLTVKQLFSSPPLKKVPKGRSYVDNPNYDAELKVWHKKWNEVCGSEPKGNFEIFEFTKSGFPRRPK